MDTEVKAAKLTVRCQFCETWNRVDANKVSATYKDGILTVTLPKAEEAKPKQIDVQVN